MTADAEYDTLVNSVLQTGTNVAGRNGNVLVKIGVSMRFSLEDGNLPFVTKKKLAWKTCLRELLWFISGSTDARMLSATRCKIWDANGSREFLDSRGLSRYREGELGPVYGHQWRSFNAPYGGADCDHRGEGVDQLANVIALLSDPATRTSRRIVMSSWNPAQLDEMALPPCHVLAQFNVVGQKLFCCLYQRSGDVGLGVPFNIASYAFLTHLLAHHCGLEAAELFHTIGNAHIYESHVPGMRDYLGRAKGTPPLLSITASRKTIEEYVESDFEVTGYACGDTLNLPFVA
jgi:thymidylate synthase